jgi:hypothetical protein
MSTTTGDDSLLSALSTVCRRLPGAALLISIGIAACGGNTSPPPPPGPTPPPPPGTARFDIAYSTYLGGSQLEEFREPVLLGSGRLLVTARTQSNDLPTTSGAFQTGYGGGVSDTYLAILSADGSSLEAATYFGGSSMERPAYGIDITNNGDIVFTSGTTSPDIPTTAGAYRRNLHQPVPSPGDGYVCRISSSLGTVRWCTYTGGGWPRGGLRLDAQDNVIVVGRALGANFAPTSGAFQTQRQGTDDGFVLKLDPNGTSAVFSTLIGGSGSQAGEVVLSAYPLSGGDISIAGAAASADFPTTAGAAQTSTTGLGDAFTARISGDGSTLRHSTLYGGSGAEGGVHAVLPDESAIIHGVTASLQLPGAAGGRSGPLDGYLAQVSADGSTVQWASFVGGSGSELLANTIVSSSGNLIVVGNTSSADLPVTSDALQSTFMGGGNDGFLLIVGPGGAVVFATYLGGTGDELIRGVAEDSEGSLYLVGWTTSDDFPITSGAFQPSRRGQEDGFIMKLTSK